MALIPANLKLKVRLTAANTKRIEEIQMLKHKNQLLAVLLSVLLVAGCSEGRGQVPTELTKAKPPLTIISISNHGVIILDGDNNLYAYDETYYFAQNIISGDLKVGDKLRN